MLQLRNADDLVVVDLGVAAEAVGRVRLAVVRDGALLERRDEVDRAALAVEQARVLALDRRADVGEDRVAAAKQQVPGVARPRHALARLADCTVAHTTAALNARSSSLIRPTNSAVYFTAACSSRHSEKAKGSPYSTTERRVPELIRVLGSQPAGDVSHKPGGRLPLFSARPAVTPATLKRAATSFAAW